MEWTGLWIFFLVIALSGLIWWVTTRSTKHEAPSHDPFLSLQQQLDTIRTDLLKVIEQNRQGIDKRLDNAATVFSALQSKMVKVEETTRQVLEVGKDISGLQQILKAPKLRGNFSEQLLGDLLSQMIPQDHFELQYTFRSGERVDAIIKTAQGLVSVDAKFPLENFSRYFASQSDEERKNLRKVLLSDVKKHVVDIAEKYIRPSEGTFDFALMYIPAENVYYEVITRDLASGEEASIAQYALRKRVIPVSPNTFYAYLQTILLGLRGMQVEGKVKEILAELSRLHKEMAAFRGDFVLVGKHLSNSLSAYEKSDKRLNRMEDKLSALETTPEAELLPAPSTVTEKYSVV